jgi:hypothetical protein
MQHSVTTADVAGAQRIDAGVDTAIPRRPRVRPQIVANAAGVIFREHRTIVMLALTYIVAGGLLLTVMGRPWPIRVMNAWVAVAWTVLSAAYLFWEFLRGPRHLRAALQPPRIGGSLLVAVLILPTQITFHAFKQSLSPILGFRADIWLHRIDVALHGQMPWMWLEPILRNAQWVRFLDELYMLWFIVLIGFVTWAGWSKSRALRQRALIALLLLWVGGGTLGAWLAPSAGPCYYGHVVAGTDPYAPLMARLDDINRDGQLRARFNQEGLWSLSIADKWAAFGGVSAMPSMHVAFAVLVALVAWARSRALGALALAFAVTIQVGSVALGWHYAVDGYAGALVALASWSGSAFLTGERRAG